MQALYRSEVVGDPLSGLLPEIEDRTSIPEEVRSFAMHLLSLVDAYGEQIDEAVSGALRNWTLERVAVIERCVLRLAAAELLYDPRTPARVVLDEAIEIAKQFGSLESGRFVNGVLDRIVRDRLGEDAL
jgi:N utilization substance protein B